MNEETFKGAAGWYNAALKENGHNYSLKYSPNHTRQENNRANQITEEQKETTKLYCVPNKKKKKKKEEGTQEQEK